MKAIVAYLSIICILFISSCCSNREQCGLIEFEQVELYNFAPEDISNDVYYYRFMKGSGWTQIVDSIEVFPSQIGVSAAEGFKIVTGFNTLEYDYAIKVNKINKTYLFGAFGTKIVKCGKCFLKNNNQYGNALSTYTLNSISFPYTSAIKIAK